MIFIGLSATAMIFYISKYLMKIVQFTHRNPAQVSADRLEEKLAILKRYGYEVVDLDK